MNTDLLMPKRNIGLWFQLDANRINARQRDTEMNQLEQWDDNGVIDLMISEPATEEAQKAGSPQRFAKARKYFHPQTLASTPDEFKFLHTIEQILLGRRAQNINEAADVEILFNTKKYAGSLITEDGDSRSQPVGILGVRDKLKSIGIVVYRTREAVTFVRKRIQLRDSLAIKLSTQNGTPIPEWIGID
jgi:hypothetical protein